MFVSVDGKAKEVKEIFAGGSDGLAHKVNELFGSVNGVAKLVYSIAPTEQNAFDQFTWAEIKQLASEGRLLEHFNKHDKVNVKLTQAIPGKNPDGSIAYYQDTITFCISQLSATGMTLVSYTATPGRFYFTYSNQAFMDDVKASTDYRAWTKDNEWGMCDGLYRYIKEIDNALPADLRDVLNDFAPLYIYEYYQDEEGKTRLRKGYDDCRVRQVSTCNYVYHREFVEERDRYEYILDESCFATKEDIYKKFIPLSMRGGYNKCYGVRNAMYQKNTNAWRYTLIFNDPCIGWNWDWENYENRNQLSSITNPEFTTYNPVLSNVIPEIQIGVI